MFPEFRLFPEQGSTLAPRVDALFLYITAVGLVMTVLVAGLVITFAVRYRRRSEAEFPPPKKANVPLEIAWTVVPLLFVLSFFGWSASVYFDIQRPPDDALEIFVVGRQWMWKAQHPDGQREVNTLHIPVGVPVKVTLTSEDVIHSFYVPAFRTKQDAVPGRYTTTWFQAKQRGVHHLFCAEYCGTEHSKMIGQVIAMEPDEYEVWLSRGADESMAVKGRRLFSKLQCITCHTGDASGRGPSLEEIWGKMVPLADGRTVRADDNYLRESIRLPAEKIVAGFQPIMPAFHPPKDEHDQAGVSEEELLQLIAFLRTLGKGQTPPRVEQTPAPEAPAKRDGKKD